jgi:hypothetical protein
LITIVFAQILCNLTIAIVAEFFTLFVVAFIASASRIKRAKLATRINSLSLPITPIIQDNPALSVRIEPEAKQNRESHTPTISPVRLVCHRRRIKGSIPRVVV